MRTWLLLHGWLSLATVCGGRVYVSQLIKPLGFEARCSDGRHMDFALPVNLDSERMAEAIVAIGTNFCARETPDAP